jgi:radical SAM protein with 4Fe4S-binding SPASM domain
LILQPYQILDLFDALPAIARRCAEAKVLLWPADNVGYFGPHETLLRGAYRPGHWAGCHAGAGAIGIEADGTIKGCASLATAAFGAGNVRDHSLEDIWRRSETLALTRDRSASRLWGACRTCYYADFCRAGCSATSFVLFGRMGCNPYCHHRALELRRQGRRERLVPRTSAPGLPFDWRTFDLVEEDWPGP